jgi:DNA-binding transcriptional MerR regulator
MERFSPGQVAEQTGFSLDTLRYYERIGLLDDIARNSGGQRVFTEDDVAWLRILRCLRDTGMPIARMVRYAELARGTTATSTTRSRTCGSSRTTSARRSPTTSGSWPRVSPA